MLRDWTFEITSIYDPLPVVGLAESDIKTLIPENFVEDVSTSIIFDGNQVVTK